MGVLQDTTSRTDGLVQEEEERMEALFEDFGCLPSYLFNYTLCKIIIMLEARVKGY